MVADVLGKRVAGPTLLITALPKPTREAFLYCATLKFLQRGTWYLAGGTALALQVGHRQSVDLDFFTPQPRFRETDLERNLLETKSWTTSFRQEGTLYGVLRRAKASFIAYPFFQPADPFVRYGTLRLLTPSDIAAMKIVAVSQRGRKRDFVDLYWYCRQREPLSTVVQRAARQYPGQHENVNHILRSLTYFADAEADPMPRLNFSVTWAQVKRYFQTEVPKIARELLGPR